MSVRLLDLNPTWIEVEGRRGVGIAFDCMTGRTCAFCEGANRLLVLFSNPLDGGAAWPGDCGDLVQQRLRVYGERMVKGCGTHRWTRSGDELATLSMTPSVDAHSCGHLTLRHGTFE